jgi:small subunit ribosomal protein S3
VRPVAIERKFVADNIKRMQVKEYMEKELDRAGCGRIEIQRTPMGTRVIVDAQRPGLVIGRKGQAIRKMTNVLKKRFALDNPQIEVNELGVPELNAQVMAESIASSIERGIHFRRAAYMALRKIMEAGARGVEVSISGKLTGDRSKSVKFLDGYLKHCGDPAILYVRHGVATAFPKPGVIGVKVKIMPPGITLPDDIEFIEEERKAEVKKVEKAKEEIEELVEEIVEEIGVEEGAPKKKIKPEKLKKKVKKKISEEEVLVPEPVDAADAEEEPSKKEEAAKKDAEKDSKAKEPADAEEEPSKKEEAAKKDAGKASKAKESADAGGVKDEKPSKKEGAAKKDAEKASKAKVSEPADEEKVQKAEKKSTKKAQKTESSSPDDTKKKEKK